MAKVFNETLNFVFFLTGSNWIIHTNRKPGVFGVRNFQLRLYLKILEREIKLKFPKKTNFYTQKRDHLTIASYKDA